MDGVLVVAKIWLASKPKVRGLDTAAAGQKERQLPAAIPSWPRSRDVFRSDSIPKSAAVGSAIGCTGNAPCPPGAVPYRCTSLQNGQWSFERATEP